MTSYLSSFSLKRDEILWKFLLEWIVYVCMCNSMSPWRHQMIHCPWYDDIPVVNILPDRLVSTCEDVLSRISAFVRLRVAFTRLRVDFMRLGVNHKFHTSGIRFYASKNRFYASASRLYTSESGFHASGISFVCVCECISCV